MARIEPVLALTHAPRSSGGRAPCAAVDTLAVERFTRRLARAAHGDSAHLLAPENSARCGLCGLGSRCAAPDLNFIPPRQYVGMLLALKAKAFTFIKSRQSCGA